MEDRVVVLGVGVRGPLAGYVSGFAGVLVDRGYAPGSVLQQLCPVSQLSRWLDAEGLGVDGLTELEAERFLAARRARGVRLFRSLLALEPVLGYLRGLGVAPAVAAAAPVGPVEELLERYRRYLLVERGLTVASARLYLESVRGFVERFDDGDGLALDRLGSAQVSGCVGRDSNTISAARGGPQMLIRAGSRTPNVSRGRTKAVSRSTSPSVADLASRLARHCSGCV
jgi:integrase/recombinase XerD